MAQSSFFLGRFLRLVVARSSNSLLFIDFSMSFDAPLSLLLGMSPRFAARAAPAAFCWAWDFAGMTASLIAVGDKSACAGQSSRARPSHREQKRPTCRSGDEASRSYEKEQSMGDKTLPPQHQEHQPGDEHKMTPRPDYTPRYPGSGRLKDKVAVITGADSGIGSGTAV